MARFIQGLIIGSLLGGLFGVGLGIYILPILTAEEGASVAVVDRAVRRADRIGVFKRDLADSDFGHWGEGTISLSRSEGSHYLTLQGEVAPGPDYKLYLIPHFVETEQAFLKIKSRSALVAPVKSYTNFHIKVPSHIDTNAYQAVLIWCEAFQQFITAAELNVP